MENLNLSWMVIREDADPDWPEPLAQGALTVALAADGSYDLASAARQAAELAGWPVDGLVAEGGSWEGEFEVRSPARAGLILCVGD